MEEQIEPKTDGFIQMSLDALKAISRTDGGYNELAAYIVLCSGVNGRHAGRYCTHGAKSVEKRSGMSYRSAEKALSWLSQYGFIREPQGIDPKFLGKTASRANSVQWVLLDEPSGLDVAVSRQFVDGTKGASKDSPLKRLLLEVNGTEEIPRGQAVIDAILVFASLMREQDFGECAGVDPEKLHQSLPPIADDEDGDGTKHVVPIPESNGVLVTVRAGSDSTSMQFICDAFGEEVPKERDQLMVDRFWNAIAELRRVQLLYRVLVMWNGNPLKPEQRRKSEPIATHYINDRWARTMDPHLQTEVHRAIYRTGARDAYCDFGGQSEIDGNPFAGSGRYRYMVTAKGQKQTHLIGQVRVRYWPANASTVRGRNLEKRRTESFLASIKAMGKA